MELIKFLRRYRPKRKKASPLKGLQIEDTMSLKTETEDILHQACVNIITQVHTHTHTHTSSPRYDVKSGPVLPNWRVLSHKKQLLHSLTSVSPRSLQQLHHKRPLLTLTSTTTLTPHKGSVLITERRSTADNTQVPLQFAFIQLFINDHSDDYLFCNLVLLVVGSHV